MHATLKFPRSVIIVMGVLIAGLLIGCAPIAKEAFVTPSPTPIRIPYTPTPPPPAGVPRPSTVDAESIEGEWSGTLHETIYMRLLLEMRSGDWYGSVELPGLLTGRKTLGHITVQPPLVRFVMDSGASFATTFEGIIGEDGMLRGDATSEGQIMPFALRPVGGEAINRDSFASESVDFLSGAVRLAGTLTSPAGDGPFPAVVLLGDGGPQNRDGETLFPPGSAPMRQIAEKLTQAGYMVLRLDDRGTGDSSGDFFFADYADLTRDGRSAVNFLLKRDDVRSDALGLVGYGEGATVAAMVARETPEVAYVAGIAAPGVDGVVYLKNQVRSEGAALDMHQERIDGMLDLVDGLVDAVENGPAPLVSAYLPLLLKRWNDASKMIPEEAESAALLFGAGSFWNLIGAGSRHDLDVWATNPLDVWSEVSLPVLLVTGSLDRQSAPEQNQALIADAVKAAGNLNVAEVVVEGMNHLLLLAENGSIAEYPRLDPELAEELPLVLVEWLDQVVATQNE